MTGENDGPIHPERGRGRHETHGADHGPGHGADDVVFLAERRFGAAASTRDNPGAKHQRREHTSAEPQEGRLKGKAASAPGSFAADAWTGPVTAREFEQALFELRTYGAVECAFAVLALLVLLDHPTADRLVAEWRQVPGGVGVMILDGTVLDAQRRKLATGWFPMDACRRMQLESVLPLSAVTEHEQWQRFLDPARTPPDAFDDNVPWAPDSSGTFRELDLREALRRRDRRLKDLEISRPTRSTQPARPALILITGGEPAGDR